MKYVDLIIFDLDGTLVDSREDIANAVEQKHTDEFICYLLDCIEKYKNQLDKKNPDCKRFMPMRWEMDIARLGIALNNKRFEDSPQAQVKSLVWANGKTHNFKVSEPVLRDLNGDPVKCRCGTVVTKTGHRQGTCPKCDQGVHLERF